MDKTELKFNLELTEAEGDVLCNLIDAAIRVDGLKAATAAIPLVNRMREALLEAKRPKTLSYSERPGA